MLTGLFAVLEVISSVPSKHGQLITNLLFNFQCIHAHLCFLWVPGILVYTGIHAVKIIIHMTRNKYVTKERKKYVKGERKLGIKHYPNFKKCLSIVLNCAREGIAVPDNGSVSSSPVPHIVGSPRSF